MSCFRIKYSCTVTFGFFCILFSLFQSLSSSIAWFVCFSFHTGLNFFFFFFFIFISVHGPFALISMGNRKFFYCHILSTRSMLSSSHVQMPTPKRISNCSFLFSFFALPLASHLYCPLAKFNHFIAISA